MPKAAWSFDADVKGQAVARPCLSCTQVDDQILDRFSDALGGNWIPVVNRQVSALRTTEFKGLYREPYILNQMPMAVSDIAEGSKT